MPCPNLGTNSACGIHARLATAGFPGCVSFDCFGAGQHVTQLATGREWRGNPAIATSMFGAFATMRRLHELLWYLTDALQRPAAAAVHDILRHALDETVRLTGLPAEQLATYDLTMHAREVTALLSAASELVRSAAGAQPRRRRKVGKAADLIGADLRDVDLRGADLRGAYLIACDLRGAQLGLADVLGADFRAADLRGADLAETIFLTQPQLDSANGDATTMLGERLTTPTHWSRPGS